MSLRLAATISMLTLCVPYNVSHAEEIDDLSNIDYLTPLTDTNLGVQNARGGEKTTIDELNIQINNLDQSATLDNNVVHSSITGYNSISNGAFSDLTGFATVIQNSGNNVIIQNATIVNFASHQ